MFYKIDHHIVEVSVHHLLLVTNSRAHGYVTNRICQFSTMQSRQLCMNTHSSNHHSMEQHTSINKELTISGQL